MTRLAGWIVALALAAPGWAAGSLVPLDDAAASMAAALAALETATLQTAAVTDDGVAALAAAMTGFEAALAESRDAVRGAGAREDDLTSDLQARRVEIARLLAALQALGRARAEVQSLHPRGPIGAARTTATIASLTPALQGEVATLAAQLAEIETAKAMRVRGKGEIEAALTALSAARAGLIAALHRRAPADVEVSAAVTATAPAAPAADVLRNADTLSALAKAMAAPGLDVGRPGDVKAAPLVLRWPVAGRILGPFDAADAAGVRRPGLLLEAAPLSVVTAPADGRVRYAGPFLDYGYVVVLEPRSGVLIVLAGLATLETRTGADLQMGALLGMLGGRALDAQEYLMLGTAGTNETPAESLYIEIWYGLSPVDPALWLPRS